MAESNEIRIFNPKDKPYGALSNNKKFAIELGGYVYPTITHYTFTSMLHFPTFKALVRNTKNTKDVMPLAQEYYQKEIEDTSIIALFEAYKVLFKNEQPKQTLLSTGNSNIIYISDNLLLGSQFTKEGFIGKNQVGNCLMKLRKEIREEELFSKKSRDSEAMIDSIYNIYKAYSGLDAYVADNKKDVQEFTDYNYDELIELAPPNMTWPEKRIVMDLYKQGKLEFINLEIENPGNLVDIYRKFNIEKIKQGINIRRSNIIFNMYIEYWMNKLAEKEGDISDIDRRKVVDNFKSRLTGEGYTDLRQRVLYLFKKGFLSANLSDKIEEKLVDYKEIDTRDVKKAKNIEFSKKDDKDSTTPESSNKLLYISDTEETPDFLKVLSPNYSGIILDIKNRKYPSVHHYTIIKLISLLHEHTVNTAYSNMIVEGRDEKYYTDIYTLVNIYETMKAQEYMLMQEATKRAMDKKFTDLTLAQLLLSTGDKKLVYTDRMPALGTGTRDYPGTNFVGEYLMQLRTRIFVEMQELYKNIINVENISETLLEDKFFRDWMTKRLDELCGLVGFLEGYFMEKYSLDYPIPVNEEFIKIILQEFYGSCFKLYMENLEIEVPGRFSALVEECKMFGNPSMNVVKMLWKYFASIIYTLIKSVDRPSSINIRKVISASQKSMTKLRKDTPIKITQDRMTNYIYCSMINILYTLKSLSEKYIQSPYFLGVEDIDTATKIILNSDREDKDTLISNNFSPEEIAILTNELKNLDSMTGANLAEYFADGISFISQTNLIDKNTKINRLNYFCEK